MIEVTCLCPCSQNNYVCFTISFTGQRAQVFVFVRLVVVGIFLVFIYHKFFWQGLYSSSKQNEQNVCQTFVCFLLTLGKIDLFKNNDIYLNDVRISNTRQGCTSPMTVPTQ